MQFDRFPSWYGVAKRSEIGDDVEGLYQYFVELQGPEAIQGKPRIDHRLFNGFQPRPDARHLIFPIAGHESVRLLRPPTPSY